MAPKPAKAKPAPLVPDGEIWAQVARQVQPLPRRHEIVPRELPPLPKVLRPETPGPADFARAENLRKAPAKAPPRQLPEMDGRLKQKLIQGRIPVEQRLDLHGLTLREAERAMDRLLRQAIACGQRGLLVITGKGVRVGDAPPPLFEQRGVLRAWLPDYLRQGPWRDQVLGIAPARQEQGGAGAFFVLLRRQR